MSNGVYTHARPIGVTIIVVVLWIQALLGIAAGVFLMIENNDADLLRHVDASSDDVMALGIVIVIVGVITAMFASALGRASNFARWVIGFLALLHLAGTVYSFVTLDGVTRGTALFDGLLALVVLYFLFGEKGSEEFFTG